MTVGVLCSFCSFFFFFFFFSILCWYILLYFLVYFTLSFSLFSSYFSVLFSRSFLLCYLLTSLSLFLLTRSINGRPTCLSWQEPANHCWGTCTTYITYIHTEERREVQKKDRIENGECRIEHRLAVYTETDCRKCRHQNQRVSAAS